MSAVMEEFSLFSVENSLGPREQELSFRKMLFAFLAYK